MSFARPGSFVNSPFPGSRVRGSARFSRMLKKTLIEVAQKRSDTRRPKSRGMRRTVQYVAVTRDEGNAVDGCFSATCQSDIKSLIDPPLVFRAEDRESAHFGRGAHMRSPTRLRIKALDLHDADLAV